MEKANWLYCPICHNKTRLKMRKDTELKNFPLYCPKCKNESLINVRQKYCYTYKRARRKDAEPMNV